jgi:hypothetical protein
MVPGAVAASARSTKEVTLTIEELIPKLEDAIKQATESKDKAQATAKESDQQFVYLSGMVEGYMRVLNTIRPPQTVEAEVAPAS